MSDIHLKLQELAARCQAILDAMRSPDAAVVDASAKTQAEYTQQGKQLLEHAKRVEGGLYAAVQSTSSVSTFRKRLAALGHFLDEQNAQLKQQLSRPSIPSPEILHLRLTQHLQRLQTLQRLRQEGMTAQRAKRRSKRQSLAGLPANWRTALCKRAASGRYLFALIVLTLTGCRPSELANGIQIWRGKDEGTGKHVIHFQIRGAKVKAAQGQPLRTISYNADDPHPLVGVVNKLLNSQEEPHVFAQVRSAINLTVEIRRLAHSLWPKHKHTVTAYSFRHQFAADLKASVDEDATSRGLGHLSAATRRVYGTASQASKGQRLRPLQIEAERPVKPRGRGPCTKKRGEPSP